MRSKSRLGPGEEDPFSTLARQQIDQGHSLLYLAISNGMIPLTEWLLKTQPSSFSLTAPFTGYKDARTSPLHLATMNGHVTTACLLLDKGAESRAQDSPAPGYCQWTYQHGCSSSEQGCGSIP